MFAFAIYDADRDAFILLHATVPVRSPYSTVIMETL